ncbi:MAG: ABC transporter permease [Thiomonas delicata]
MRDITFSRPLRGMMLAPAVAIFAAFWLLPMAALARISAGEGLAGYLAILTNARYLRSLATTLALAGGVTLTALALALIAGLFLARRRFPGRHALIAMLTLPLAFPGVVVGFMVIMLAGRQGLLADAAAALFGHRVVFAYSLGGLFLGYLYFSIPRVILTLMAAAEKLDPALEEAARSLGASSWQVLRDVVLPALAPALAAASALCFATAVGAFCTAVTLATDINVLPMVIYTAFTLNADLLTAATLSLVLGAVTWLVLAWADGLDGQTVATGA